MTLLLVCARALHFGSGLIMVGVAAFRWLVLQPGLCRERGEVWSKLTPFYRQLSSIFMASAAIHFLSDFALFWISAANMSGWPLLNAFNVETFSTVLFQTNFGAVCLFRSGCVLVFLTLLIPLVRAGGLLQRRKSRPEILIALTAVPPRRRRAGGPTCRLSRWANRFLESKFRCRASFSRIGLADRPAFLQPVSTGLSRQRG